MLFACSDPKPSTCSAEVIPLFHTDAMNKPGGHVYFSVHNFDSSNIDCFTFLENGAKDVATSYLLPVTVHFLDSLDNFQLPESGMYGSEEIRKKVIMSYTLLANLNELLSFDPMGYGTYMKPQ